ncbi:MAG: hypothetical protein RL264_1987 [Bacteroidota bacterium]|jgi:PAS domain S-box-containing protein
MSNLEQEFHQLLGDNSSLLDFVNDTNYDGLWIRNLENNLYWSQDKFWELLGLRKPAEDFDFDPSTVMVKEDFEQIQNIIGQYLSNPKGSFNAILRYYKTDGTIVWMNCKGKAILNADGKPIRIIGAHAELGKIVENQELNFQSNKQAKIGFWQLKTDDNSLYISITTKQILEIPIQFNPTINDLKQFMNPEVIEQMLNEVIVNGKIETIQELTTFKGSQKYFRIISTNTVVENGEQKSIYGTIQDVTSEQLGQKKLKESEEKYRLLVDNLSDILVHVNPTGEITYVAGALKIELGYSVENVLHQNLLNFIHQEDIQFVLRDIQLILKGNKNPEIICFRILNTEGKYKWFRASALELYGPDGTIEKIQVLLGNADEMIRSKQELENSKRFIEEATKIGRVGAWEYDPIKGELYWSDFLREIFGVDEFYCPTLKGALGFYVPESRTTISNALNGVLEKEGSYSEELELINANGKRFWIRCSAKSIHRDGKCIRVNGMIQDIDYRKRLEIQLKEESEHRKRVAESLIIHKEKIRNDMYNDLQESVNQLLFAAKLNIENVLSDSEDLNTALNHLTSAINEIRRVAIENTSQFILENDFQDIVNEYLSRLNERENVRFYFDNQISDWNGILPMMKVHIFRFFQELVTNTLKHANATEMTMRLKQNQSEIILVAIDNGVGLSENHNDGIGLLSLKNRVYLLEGEYKYRTQKNRGLIHFIRIPILNGKFSGTRLF